MPDEEILNEQNTPEAQPTETVTTKTPEQIAAEETEAKEATFWNELETKAVGFTAKANRSVLPFSLPGKEPDTHVVGYMYEPDNEIYDAISWAKLFGGSNSLSVAKGYLEGLVWWHESDPDMRSRQNMNGAAIFLLGLVKVALPEYKKK